MLSIEVFEEKVCQPRIRLIARSRIPRVLALILLLGGSVLMAAEPPFQLHHPVRGEGLTVIEGNAPAFNLELKRLLEDGEIAKASPFLPYSLILVNNTGRYIWGFTVIYTFPDRIAPAGTPWQHQIVRTAASFERDHMFGPKASYLITPVTDFLAMCDAGGKRPVRPYLDEGMDRMIALFVSQHLTERIEASIDSIIFEDGTIAGPDAAGRMEKVNGRLSAVKELLNSVENLRGEELRAKLSYYAGLQSTDDGARQRMLSAQSLLEAFDSQGEPAALQMMGRMGAVKRFGNSRGVTRRNQ